MTLSHKGRYWQISGLEKQVGLRAIIYISGPAGECSKGRFAHCSVVRGARSVPLFPTRPRRPFPSFLHCRRGGRLPLVSVAGPYGVASGSNLTLESALDCFLPTPRIRLATPRSGPTNDG